jgi:single stranded DNA-binding protein
MAADNHTTIVGNLVEDPEVRFTNTGIAVTNLRVAVTQRVQQDGQWRDGETSFFKVNVWRGQAENLAESLGKGDRVMVTGRLRQRSWETPEGDKAVGHRTGGRRGRRQPQVGHGQGRAHQPARQWRPCQRSGAAGRARRGLQRRAALLTIHTRPSVPPASAGGAAVTDQPTGRLQQSRLGAAAGDDEALPVDADTSGGTVAHATVPIWDAGHLLEDSSQEPHVVPTVPSPERLATLHHQAHHPGSGWDF